MNHCPLCLHQVYLDPDEPHVLGCVLRYGVYVRIGDGPWTWWSRG